jgi:hypothetical protein
MIGLTPLADADRYLLTPAALQTTNGTFVAPDDASLTATSSLLTPDPSTDTWPIPYGDFEQSAGAAAYPGTMVVYAAIPTTGLSSALAQDYASFLQFAATTGQTTGVGVGQLPPGYLPLTPANGLSALASYTQAAALDVSAQNGQVPALPGAGAGDGGASPTSPSAGDASPNFNPNFSSNLGLNGSFADAFFTKSGLRVGPHSGGHGGRPVPAEMVASELSPIKALWTSGFPIAMVFGLGAIGAVTVPLTFKVGRRRGKW